MTRRGRQRAGAPGPVRPSLLVAAACALVAYAAVAAEHPATHPAASAVVAPVFIPGTIVAPSRHARGGPGWFASSDPLLDRIWTASVDTSSDMVAPGDLQDDALGRPCPIAARVVILDGFIRDRCPYVGDESVTDLALDASDPHFAVQRSMLAWFAAAQHRDGAIPASPLDGGSIVLFDYNAYWLQALYGYALHSGDLAFVRRVWPHVERLMGWYARHTLARGPDRGLLVNDLGARDYGFIARRGDVVAYYNAQYVLALHETVELADWIGRRADAAAWEARAAAVTRGFDRAFWNAKAGAFDDTTRDATTHPQDGNAFAILAGIASPAQARSALAYLTRHDARADGNTLVDSTAWNDPRWGRVESQLISPFMSYYELLARFSVGLDASAYGLLEREWGYMTEHGPRTTVWETIDATTGAPAGPNPSWDHGWSSGAAPAISEYVLGVEPTSPGFATFTVTPHPGTLRWASGAVPTPRGAIEVSWTDLDHALRLHVTAPPGTVWTNGPAGRPAATATSAGSHGR